MQDEKLTFIQNCESNYGMSTEEFIEWYETADGERSETEETWYRYVTTTDVLESK